MISVIVCTFNRGGRLDACFDALAVAGKNAPAGWELIVVDNGSSDDTRAVVQRRAMLGDLPLRCITEQRRGLSHARNAGVTASTQPVVAFTDDDCLVAPDWLQSIAAALADPRLSILGGRVTLHDDADYPVSIRPFLNSEAISDFDAIGRYLIGCNMATRRSVFADVGLFDVRLGAGAPARSAEDLDFFYRCLKRGMTLRYSPHPHVFHAHGRRTAAEIAELADSYVTGRGAFYFKHVMRGDGNALKHLYWEIRSRRAGFESSRKTLRRLLSGGFGYILRR